MDRPRDACPYPKPFLADFRDCPAFQPRQFIPLDTMYQPLEPVITCRHMQTRALAERHRWYGACALGDAEARRRWARQLGAARLERIRRLQLQLGDVMAPYSSKLWGLKGQQLRALRDGRDAAPTTLQLRELGGDVMAALDAYLQTHEAEFAAVDMPVEAARELIRAALERFIETRYSAEISFEVPDDVLQRFPPAVRTFFRPSVQATIGSQI